MDNSVPELTESFQEIAPTNNNKFDINLFVGKRIRRRRKLLGMTQDQLAEKVGIRFQQIQKYECGANRLNVSNLALIAIALDEPNISYFFPTKEEMLNLDNAVKSFRDDKPPIELKRLMAEWPNMDRRSQELVTSIVRAAIKPEATPGPANQ